MTIVSDGRPGMVLVIVAAVAVVSGARRVILRRRAARRVDRWTRESIDSGRLMREFTEPVTPGHGTNPRTGHLHPRHPEREP
jgi:hypothetical protein